MKKHVHLFEDYRENGTDEEIVTLSIEELLVPERHLYSTMMDILNGGTPKTNDPILSIWITESGRNFLIDGHHRLFNMLLKGIKTRGDGAHQELIDYVANNYLLEEQTRKFLQQMRDYRNRIAYEGFMVHKNYVSLNEKKIKEIIRQLFDKLVIKQ